MAARKRVVEFVLRVNDGKARVALKKTSKSAAQLKKETEGISGAALRANRAMASFATGLGGAVAVVVGFGLAVFAAGQKLADMRNNLLDFGARSGFAVRTIEALQFAAEGSGQALNDMDRATKPLIKLLGDLRAGNASATKKLDDFALSLTDSSGAVVSNDEALKRLIARMQEIDDQGERSSWAVGLLGSSASKLAQAVGDRSLESYAAEVEAVGGLSADAADASDGWQRSVAALKLVFRGLANALPLGALADFLGNLNLVTILISGQLSAAFKILMTYLERAGKSFELLFSGDFSGLASHIAETTAELYDMTAELLSGDPGREKVFAVLRARQSGASGPSDPYALPDGADRAVIGPEPQPKKDASKAEADAKRRATDEERRIAKLGTQQDRFVEQLMTAFGSTLPEAGRGLIVAMKEGGAAIETAGRHAAREIAIANEEAVRAQQDAAVAERADRMSSIEGSLGAVGGGLSGILSMLGPEGAIASAVISLAANGAEILDGITESVMSALTGLPELLTEAIPSFITSLITEVIPAIRSLALRMPILIAKALFGVLKGMLDSLNPFKSQGGRGFLGIKGTVNDLVGEFATGTGYVPRTGLAMVHQGEAIVPRGASVGQTASTSGGGPVINITINGGGLDDDASVQRLVRRLRRVLGDRQLGESLTGYA